MNSFRSLHLFTALIFILSTSPLWAQRSGQSSPPVNQPPATRPADRSTEPGMQDRDMKRDRDRMREHTPAKMDEPERDSLAERLQLRNEWCSELGLTEQQQAEVQQICERQRKEIKGVKNRWFITRKTKQERIREIVNRHDRDVDALLAREQKRLLESLRMRQNEQFIAPEKDVLPEKN